MLYEINEKFPQSSLKRWIHQIILYMKVVKWIILISDCILRHPYPYNEQG